MKNINWNSVPDPVELPRLTPGGYVCKITVVVDVPEKEYLKLEYDIAEGAHKGHWDLQGESLLGRHVLPFLQGEGTVHVQGLSDGGQGKQLRLCI